MFGTIPNLWSFPRIFVNTFTTGLYFSFTFSENATEIIVVNQSHLWCTLELLNMLSFKLTKSNTPPNTLLLLASSVLVFSVNKKDKNFTHGEWKR